MAKKVGSTNQEIADRRQRVMDMLDRGANTIQIARELGLTRQTISTDLRAINRKANDVTNELVREGMNAMFQSCIRSLNNLILECWSIYARDNNDQRFSRDPSKQVSMNHRLRAIELMDKILTNKVSTICNGPGMMELHRLQSEVANLKRGLDISV